MFARIVVFHSNGEIWTGSAVIVLPALAVKFIFVLNARRILLSNPLVSPEDVPKSSVKIINAV